MREVFRGVLPLPFGVVAQGGEAFLQLRQGLLDQLGGGAGHQGVLLVGQVRQVVDGLVPECGWPGVRHTVGEEVGGGAGVRRPGVGTEQPGVAAVGTEGCAADQDGDGHGLAGGDRRVCGGKPGGDRAGQPDGLRPGPVQMGDQMGRGHLRAEEVHPPAPQPQHLGEESGGQRMPFTVHAGHRDTSPLRRGGRWPVMREGRDDPVVDGRGGVLLCHRHPVRRPVLTDPVLDGGDDVEQHVLRRNPRVHRVENPADGRVLVHGHDRVPQVVDVAGQAFRHRSGREGHDAHLPGGRPPMDPGHTRRNGPASDSDSAPASGPSAVLGTPAVAVTVFMPCTCPGCGRPRR